MTLRDLRKEKGLTQRACAELLHVPLRTYIRYETDEGRRSSVKYAYLLDELRQKSNDEGKERVLTTEDIRATCAEIFKRYEVDFCYLFGSYAKGKATEKSDVDLLISTPAGGLKFFEIVETVREKLEKRIDALHQTQLNDNFALVNEILKDGIKIYG